MPSCSTTCPKVKSNLKKQAAERKKALGSEYDPDVRNDDGRSTRTIPVQRASGHKSRTESERGFQDSGSKRSQSGKLDFDRTHTRAGKGVDSEYPETSSRSGRSKKSYRSQEGGLRNKIQYGNSEDEGSDGDSRGPGRNRRNGDVYSGPSEATSRDARGHTAELKSHKRPGRRGSSGNSQDSDSNSDASDNEDYFSSQSEQTPDTDDFDLSKHNPCSSECSLEILKEEMMRKKLEEKQKIVDDYLLNKGMNYFEDLCACSSSCLAKQLWNDPFIRKIFVSMSVFALGMKVCFEMDGWYLPTLSNT